ncbi:MAG: DUF4125 domain-containing protein [Acidobacteria bacterium]|nr:MAG: DUF4125 domain-containing protein [Acidobacteriota bacterium]
MSEKSELIKKLLDVEWKMFKAVRAEEPVSCQQDPEGFRLHRGAQFSVWSEATLQSYLDDLVKAEEKGENLLTLKYARMENIVPILNFNLLICQILDLQVEAQREMQEKYPAIASRGRKLEDSSEGATSFRSYLQSELETYSDRTLDLLYKDIQETNERGENWSILTHSNLFKQMGFTSIDEVEKRLSAQ